MQDPHTDIFSMVAQTLAGLEIVLAGELTALGAQNVTNGSRAVYFEGTLKTMYLANISSRTAIRILVPVHSFPAPDEAALYEEIKKMKWEDYFGVDETFAIEAITSTSALDHSQFIALKTKDAIADRFRDRFNRRPNVDTKKPTLQIHVRLSKDQCTVSFDTTGVPLYKRGYREDGGEAPLNEILAAGLIMLSGWDKKANFVDGMCGSGTFLIEAALIAKNQPSSFLRREYNFMRWKRFLPYHAQIFNEARDAAFAKKSTRVNSNICGSDILYEQLGCAIANIKKANLSHELKVQLMPFDQLIPPSGGGTLILNPPYGERITPEDINKLYESIGDTLKKRYKGYDAWILSSNKEAIKHIGLHPSKKIKVFNGPLECEFLKFEMYAGTRKIKKLNEEENEQAAKSE